MRGGFRGGGRGGGFRGGGGGGGGGYAGFRAFSSANPPTASNASNQFLVDYFVKREEQCQNGRGGPHIAMTYRKVGDAHVWLHTHPPFLSC
jgi:hypothetical protein